MSGEPPTVGGLSGPRVEPSLGARTGGLGSLCVCVCVCVCVGGGKFKVQRRLCLITSETEIVCNRDVSPRPVKTATPPFHLKPEQLNRALVHTCAHVRQASI